MIEQSKYIKTDNIECDLKSTKEWYPTDYLLLCSIILFMVLVLAIFIDYIFTVNIFIVKIIGFTSLFLFTLWFILTWIKSKSRIIGKVKFSKENMVIIRSNVEQKIDLKEVKDFEITFKYYLGEFLNIWGMADFASGGNNKLFFVYQGQEYNYLFDSKHSDDKKWLTNIIRYWKKNGISCKYLDS